MAAISPAALAHPALLGPHELATASAALSGSSASEGSGPSPAPPDTWIWNVSTTSVGTPANALMQATTRRTSIGVLPRRTIRPFASRT